MLFRAPAGTINGMESPIAQPESPLEILRRLENLVRLGTIAEVRHAKPARVRVKTGKVTTAWRPWFALRAGEDREWDPPTVGEPVILFQTDREEKPGSYTVRRNGVLVVRR